MRRYCLLHPPYPKIADVIEQCQVHHSECFKTRLKVQLDGDIGIHAFGFTLLPSLAPTASCQRAAAMYKARFLFVVDAPPPWPSGAFRLTGTQG